MGLIKTDMSSLDSDISACNQAGGTFQDKLAASLNGLLNANKERKSEIDGLRKDHEELKKNHEQFVTSAERENDLRRNEIKSLEEECKKRIKLVLPTSLNWTASSTPKIIHAKPKSPIWITVPNPKTMLANPKSQTWTTSLNLKTRLAKTILLI